MHHRFLNLVFTISLALPFAAPGLAQVESYEPVQLSLVKPAQLVPEYQSIRYLRLNLGYSVNDNVHGLDMGLFNSAYGHQKGVALGLWNRTDEYLHGVQLGLVGSVGDELRGAQIGAFTFAELNSGLQVGLVNRASTIMNGVQVGLVNYADDLIDSAVQVGLINVSAEMPRRVLPLVNVNF